MKNLTNAEKALFWRKYTKTNISDRYSWLIRYSGKLGYLGVVTAKMFEADFNPKNYKEEIKKPTPEEIEAEKKHYVNMEEACDYATKKVGEHWLENQITEPMYVEDTNGDIIWYDLAQDIFNSHYDDKMSELEPLEVEADSIHVIYLLDSSSSMNVNNKIKASEKALKNDIKALKEESESKSVDISVSIHMFSSSITSSEHYDSVDLVNEHSVNLRAYGGTALYDSVVEVLNSCIRPTTKYLVKVLTDGQDEHSRKETIESCIKKINESKATVVFNGTKEDVVYMVRQGFDASNVLAHENSASSIEEVMKVTTEATRGYIASVVDGKAVKSGFFKQFN